MTPSRLLMCKDYIPLPIGAILMSTLSNSNLYVVKSSNLPRPIMYYEQQLENSY